MSPIHRRLSIITLALVGALLASLAATATATARSAVTGTVSIVGPWSGADEQSFRAVLDAFRAANPGVDVRYTAMPTGAASSLTAGTTADVAILRLPDELAAMRQLAQGNRIQSIDFAAATVRDTHSFAFKQLGSIGGKLYAVPFKATNESAFWYDQGSFQSRGVAPAAQTWPEFRATAQKAATTAQRPFAISGQTTSALPTLFQSVYLMKQGVQRYDALLDGRLRWDSSAVRDAIQTTSDTFAAPGKVAGGLETALESTYEQAVQRVFGSPQTAALLPGGSAAIPVLQRAEAARPLPGFGVIPFPSLNGNGPGRVVGRVDAAVMVRSTPAAQALIAYLASPVAGTAWALRGGDFLSPNRAIDPAVYRLPALRTLAGALSSASVFRLPIEGVLPAGARTALNGALTESARHPQSVGEITGRLQQAMERAMPAS